MSTGLFLIGVLAWVLSNDKSGTDVACMFLSLSWLLHGGEAD